MRFGILGPLEVDDDGRRLDLGRPKQRALLALLLVHANRVVSVDKLVDDLWAGRPPEDASAALQVQVSRLRRALAAGGDARVTLESCKPGYVLRVEPGALDAERFERLVKDACDAPPAQALTLLDEALALWRGPALAEFADETFAMSEAARLEELRLAAQEERVEAELALGRHATMVGPLRQLAERHQLRERLWGQLMVALYRCGRQAEALRTYGELRHHLGEELGIDPSPALQRLEEAVLLQAPELDWTPPPTAGAAPDTRAEGGAGPFPMDGSLEGSPFVGRQDQVEALRAEWRAAIAEGPRLVLVAGEPGVGKTRLAMELARAAHGEGARVLVGHCDEELAVPYQPFAEALARVLTGLADADLHACLAGRGGELVRLVPELAELVDDLPAPVPSDPETERYRLFEAVSRTLAALSRQTPVVLVLDDLHWAAKPTVLLLRHLVSRAAPMPLLAVATYRDTEWSGALELVDDRARVSRVSRLNLGGLDEPAVRELLRAVAGARPGEVDEGLARSIHAGTAGNPFFIGEVMRNLSDEGGAPAGWSIEAAGVPEGVRSVVRRRLSRLGDVTKRLLVVASVIGGHYHLDVLQAAVDLDEDTVLAGLEEALAAGLVAEAPGSSLRQRFTHALVRASLYDGLAAARRAQLHRQVGEALERVFADHLADHLPELAHHFSRAAELGGVAKAVRYSVLAGDRALELLAHDEAADNYQRALDLLGGAGLADEAAQRCDLLLALGEAQKRCGAPAYRLTLLDAARVAADLGDPHRLATAAVANGRGFWSATNSVDRERVSVLEAALEALPPDDGTLRARVLANLAVELVYTGDSVGVRRRSDEALTMARRLGDLPTLASVLIPRFNTLRGDPGTLPERLENTAELLAVTEQLPDPSMRFQGWGWRAMAAMEAADAPEAERGFAAFERLSVELRQPTTAWFTTYLRAARLLLSGRFDDAEVLSGEAFRLGRSAGHADAEMFFSCQRIQLAYERGGLDRWARPLRVALSRHPESSWFLRSWQALAFCETGDDDAARTIFEELAAKDFADFAFEPTWLHVMTNCAAVCAHLGDTVHAATLRALLGPYDGQFVTMSSLAYTGPVAHYLGMLAAALNGPEAAGHFESAAAVSARMGAPAWLARTRLEWARHLLATGDPAPARALLEEALGTATALGLAVVERRARDLLAQAPPA